MRISKCIRTLFLMLCMAVLFSLSAGAAETDTGTGDASVTASAVAVKKAGTRAYLIYRATGKRVTGLSGIQEFPRGSKNYYYFFKAKKGRIYADKQFRYNGKYYYAGTDGTLQRGWQTINNKTYYFHSKKLYRYSGWKTIAKKRYFFTPQGVQVTGWYRSPRFVYYLDPNQNGAKATGWMTINNNRYFFTTKKGWLRTGKFKASDGKYYYSNKSGVIKTGLIELDGKLYYFDPAGNGAMKTGWVTTGGKTYYMSAVSTRYGQAVTGWMTTGGAYYYFDGKGVMQTGWLTQGTRKYYLDTATGKMYTGQHTINGQIYNFGANGYITTQPTGPWSIRVNQGTCVVTIYRGDTPVKALICSVGLGGATPNGTFYLGVKHRWWQLFGENHYGQYTSQITGNILFHSVFYSVNGNNRTLYTSEYNKLGQPASAGCVRLNVAGAKYIYDNCPSGTKVTIFRGTSANDPLGKPAHIYTSNSWDPTDPNL